MLLYEGQARVHVALSSDCDVSLEDGGFGTLTPIQALHMQGFGLSAHIASRGVNTRRLVGSWSVRAEEQEINFSLRGVGATNTLSAPCLT